MHLSSAFPVFVFTAQDLITWLLLFAGTANTSAYSQYLFHGTSVVIYPNATSLWPGDSRFVAANFYCYFTTTGYLSFGWWLPATPGANNSHCVPRPSSYDWYEFTTRSSCGESGCRVHAVNFLTSDSHKPFFEEDYVLAALELGNGKLGELGLSYFDKAGGGYAVGTRRTLNEDTTNPHTARDCHSAFLTLKDIEAERQLDLPFELKDVCPSLRTEQAQEPLGSRA